MAWKPSKFVSFITGTMVCPRKRLIFWVIASARIKTPALFADLKRIIAPFRFVFFFEKIK
jgi:hypothetical protein